MKRQWKRATRAFQIARAFLEMGFSTAASYPVSFLMSSARPLVPVITFFFVAQLVPDTQSVGGDYYSFVIIGFLVTEALAGALGGFTHEIQTAVQQGRFEMLLVEPVRWRLLPFGLAQWPVISRAASASVAGAVAIAMGAHYRLAGVGTALLLFVLALVATLSIGVLSGAIGVLSKHSDPVLAMYTLVAGVLSGVAFPIEFLPAPVRALSWLVPHTYVITGMRKVLLEDGAMVVGPSVLQSMAALTAFNLIAFPVVLWVFGRIMETGRRTGVLSGY